MENICICGKPKKLVKNYKTKYLKTCGDIECLVKMRKATFLEKYGVEHALQSNDIKNKMKSDLLEKYGVDNVSKLTDVKLKKIETCNINFGTDYPMQSDIVLEKSKNRVLELYGVDNISKLEETIIKIQNSYNVIDEVTGKTKREIAQEKRKEYYKEKYNVEYFFQTEEFKEQYRNIMMKKYNVDNVFKSKYFRETMIENGYIKDIETTILFKDYSRKVRLLTKKTFNENYDYLIDAYLRGDDYHLDHIYSLYDGFNNDITPEIIASICNLQIIPREVNLKKQTNSWISKEELFRRYENISSKQF